MKRPVKYSSSNGCILDANKNEVIRLPYYHTVMNIDQYKELNDKLAMIINSGFQNNEEIIQKSEPKQLSLI